MKKLINTSFIYVIAAMVAGVFYREFTKFSGFSGTTVLGLTHGHLLALGVIMFLILALFEKAINITQVKLFKPFFIVYNVGVAAMAVMLVVRGIMQVVGFDGGAIVSGIAGLTHITAGVGVVMMFLVLKQAVKASQTKSEN